MQKPICPICATGKCQFRTGIACGAWICASGMMNDGRQKQTNDYGAGKQQTKGWGLDEMIDILGLKR